MKKISLSKREILETLDLIKNSSDVNELIFLMDYPEVKEAAAKKLLELWAKDDFGITIHHIVHVADNTGDPYKSEAKNIIARYRF